MWELFKCGMSYVICFSAFLASVMVIGKMLTLLRQYLFF